MTKYDDTDGRRRKDDQRFLAQLGSVVSQALHGMNVVQKGLSIALSLAAVIGGIAAAGASYGLVRAQFADLPQRVESLEEWRRTHMTEVSRPALEQQQRNTARLDSFFRSLERVEGRLERLTDLAETNNCWIRVAAGERSRFDCGGG